MEQPRSVLIVGGYGVVGTAISGLITGRDPSVAAILGGRRRHQAERVADTIPRARGVRIDITDEDPLADMAVTPDAIVVAVDDHDDRLLHAAARRGIPLVDIARWPRRVASLTQCLDGVEVSSPVVLASGWMASATSTVLAASRRGRAKARHVDIDILFALGDAAGPDSLTGFVEGLHRPFAIRDHGVPRTVHGLADPHRVAFNRRRISHPRRIDSPEHETIIASGLADGAAVRLAFDHRLVNAALAALVRSGMWGRLSRTARRRLLASGGSTGSAPHEFLLTVHDEAGTDRIRVVDSLGQAHLTAASAVTQVERLLGLHGRPRPPAGISHPEQAPDPEADVSALQAMGVEISAG